MRALITNDDGVGSAGLRTLTQAAVAAGLDVTVAAPDAERSGSSAALSALEADGKLLVQKHPLDGLENVSALAVQASPALIAFVGAYGAFGQRPDVVLSGINHGPNTGQAVLHSGTVGAAFTAASHGIPALAISLASATPTHWDTAAAVAATALEWFLPRAGEPVVVNVNVPDVPPARLRGLRAGRLASFGAVQASIGEPGTGFIPVTFSAPDAEPGPGTDLDLVRQGWASVTLLRGLREIEIDSPGVEQAAEQLFAAGLLSRPPGRARGGASGGPGSAPRPR